MYTDEQMEKWREESATVGGAFLIHLEHTARHLGAMELILGLQSGSGSATV